MKKILVFTFILGFTIMSCKKDKDKSCALTEQNLLGSYKLTSMKYKASASTPEVEARDTFLDPCEKDDIITLLSNHTYQYKDAGTQCQPNGDYNGDWSLNGNSFSVDGDVANMDNFTCSGFTISAEGYYQDGDKVTMTYQKQ
ncbi:MAG: lipocalin family protein [Ginsengibacter sp.]